jgi:peptidyl-prolyl cis-trans isomerase B (cyclophilin B)
MRFLPYSLFFLVLFGGRSGSGQEARPELDLELKVDREAAELGEKVRLTVRLVKKRGKSIEVNDLRLARNSVSLQVVAGGRTVTISRIYGDEASDPNGGGPTVVDRPPTRLRLSRGEPLQTSIDSVCLLAGENRYRAVYRGLPHGPDPLRSNERTVVVGKPAGRNGVAAVLETSKGTILIELAPERAYNTVWNFLTLANAGRYDGLTFHRVLPGYLVHGGDPQGDGTGGPGWTIPAELDAGFAHERGVVSMARKQALDTAGSQFFIMLGKVETYDGKYAAFGRVAAGMEVVDAIAAIRTVEAPGTTEKSRPIAPPVIRTVRPTTR